MDKNKIFTAPKSVRPSFKRPSTADVPTTSRKNEPPKKENNLATCRKLKASSKFNPRLNATVVGEETTYKLEDSSTDLNGAYAEIAYGKFLRTMLEECLLDEKIEREETQIDIQMGQLAERFQNTIEQLDKTNRRLKDISFVVEQKRLLDLKSQDCSNFYNITDSSDIEEKIKNLTIAEEACLDKLETKNVDFGYDNESGHKQLLDAVNDAIEGLESIKRNSNLDSDKFHEYEKSKMSLEDLEKDRFDMESLKTEFETKFPKFSEQLMKEVSEKIALVMENDD